MYHVSFYQISQTNELLVWLSSRQVNNLCFLKELFFFNLVILLLNKQARTANCIWCWLKKVEGIP